MVTLLPTEVAQRSTQHPPLERGLRRLSAAILGFGPLSRYLERHTRDLYVNYRFRTIDRYVVQSYDLLRRNFDTNELEELDGYLATLRTPSAEHIPVFLGRISKWAYAREVMRSHGERLVAPAADARTREDVQMVAVVDGSYLSLGQGEAVGALAHLVTHDLARGTYGHGLALTASFEQALLTTAQQRDERIRLIVLESRPDAQTFWRRQGYRNLRGVRYLQPPMRFDVMSGEPLTDPVPEHLMVKPIEDPSCAGVEQSLLREAVRSIYHQWYLPHSEACSAEGRRRIEVYLFDELYRDFCESLPSDQQSVMFDGIA